MKQHLKKQQICCGNISILNHQQQQTKKNKLVTSKRMLKKVAKILEKIQMANSLKTMAHGLKNKVKQNNGKTKAIANGNIIDKTKSVRSSSTCIWRFFIGSNMRSGVFLVLIIFSHV